ncbi:hypothetical protein JCM8097_003124 [Rhodosporidiobolus ruineniae]
MSTLKRRLPSLEPESTTFNERLYPLAGPTPKKPKRGEEGYGEPFNPEKRRKLFKKSCPVATQERVDRVYAQRFFCVDRTRTSEISEEFKVLGSTGNQYTVTIDHTPRCNCPDGTKNASNACKHQLFVMLKILQVPRSSNLWYQAGLLTPELQAIFAHARPAPSTVVDERVKKAYRIATGLEEPDPEEESAAAGSSSAGGVKKRIPEEGDSCPICYEDFTPSSEGGLVFCLSPTGCGNALHSVCFAQWAQTCKPTTCPMCRQKWDAPAQPAAGTMGVANPGAGPSYSSEGYQNFSAAAGISAKRDTSSYYRGPQRGRAWDGGYGRFGEDDDYGYGYGDYL